MRCLQWYKRGAAYKFWAEKWLPVWSQLRLPIAICLKHLSLALSQLLDNASESILRWFLLFLLLRIVLLVLDEPVIIDCFIFAILTQTTPPFGSGCSPASPFQNILCFPFYMNFKTLAKIIFFIQPTLRSIGGLLAEIRLFTFLPLNLYVCLQKLQGSFYFQCLGRGRNYDALAAL